MSAAILTAVIASWIAANGAELKPATEKCQTTLVRTYVDGQPRVETTRLCVDEKTRPTAQPEPGFLLSESCLKTKCFALEISAKIQNEIGGTPAFTKRFPLCASNGGRPEVIEFQWNGRWQPSDRCVFENDHSFIDTMSLIGQGRFSPGPESRIPFKRRTLERRKPPANNSGARDRKR